MRIRNSFISCAGVLGLMIAMSALSAQASFSNTSLKGSYGVLANRWTVNASDSESALVGVMTFDGAGNVTLAFTIVSDGVESTGNAGGTYSVSSNGTGTIKFTTGFTNEVDYDIVVNSTAAGLAHEITLLRTDANYPSDAVDAGTALLQATTSVTYGLGKAKGTFSLQLTTWSANESSQSDLMGIQTFDGSGNWKASVTIRNNGVLGQQTASGTYTVNSNGSGNITGTSSDGGGVKIAFVLNTVTATGPAKGMQLMTLPGSSSNKNETGIGLKQ